jgi:hypothetical protein
VFLFLKRHGLRYPKKEVVVMVQGSRIKTAFHWDRGQPEAFYSPRARLLKRPNSSKARARAIWIQPLSTRMALQIKIGFSG